MKTATQAAEKGDRMMEITADTKVEGMVTAKAASKVKSKVAKCHDDIDYIVRDIMMYKLGLDRSQLVDSAYLQDDPGVSCAC